MNEEIAGYKIHPVASLFPMMDEKSLQALADDIKANGQRDAVITDSETGEVLDGRNRLTACERAGVKPIVAAILCHQPVAWIMSRNMHRRHLSNAQKREVYAKIKPLIAEEFSKNFEKTPDLPGRPKEVAAQARKATAAALGVTEQTTRNWDREPREPAEREPRPELTPHEKLQKMTAFVASRINRYGVTDFAAALIEIQPDTAAQLSTALQERLTA